MIRTIIFDFGRVVAFFNHTPAIEKLSRMGNVPAETIKKMLYSSDLEDTYERGLISTAEFIQEVRTRLGIQITNKEFIEAFDDIFWANEPIQKLIPRLKPAYRLLLASNTNQAHFDRFSRQFADVLSCFDHLIVSQQIGERKPSHAFYNHCQAYAQADPSECVFIDDLPENIAGAVSFGWHAIVYSSFEDCMAQLKKLGVVLPDDISSPDL